MDEFDILTDAASEAMWDEMYEFNDIDFYCACGGTCVEHFEDDWWAEAQAAYYD